MAAHRIPPALLWKAAGITLAALVVYRLARWIPVPGLAPAMVERSFASGSGLPDWLTVGREGAADRLSVIALDVSPYALALLAVSLLAPVLPGLGPASGWGPAERRRLHRTVLALTFVFALLVGGAYASALSGGGFVETGGPGFTLTATLTLAGGSLLLAWLAEQIDRRGLGQGLCVLLAAGALCQLPSHVLRLIELVRTEVLSPWILAVAALALAVQAALVILIERGRRPVAVVLPRSGSRPRSAAMLLDANVAGALPALFAVTATGYLPLLLGQSLSASAEPGSWAAIFEAGQPAALALTAVLIVVFTGFLAAQNFDAGVWADAVTRGGGLPSVPPGVPTTRFLNAVTTRLTVLAALVLAAVCVLPVVLARLLGLPFELGGFDLLVVVVAILSVTDRLGARSEADDLERAHEAFLVPGQGERPRGSTWSGRITAGDR